MIFTTDLNIKYDVDVLVAGGGPAGVAAAIAAMSLNKRVLIVERNGCFGGLSTTGMVPAMARFSDGINFLADGFGRMIFNRLFDNEPITSITSMGFHSFNVEKLKKIYDELICSYGVQYLFYTQVVDVVLCDKSPKTKIDYAVCSSKKGLFAVKASVFVDCTGDANLASWAGANFQIGDENGKTMPATLCSLWSGIDFDKVRKSGIAEASRLEEAISDGIFTNQDRHLPGIKESDYSNGIGGGNVGHCFGIDPLDEASMSSGVVFARKTFEEYLIYYRDYLEGYEDMHLCYSSDLLGIRESRRIVGEYVLNINDFINKAVFEDEIGRYSYPVDIHMTTPTEQNYLKFKKEYTTLRYGIGESYGIPYRALIPQGIDNLICAGKCISTDRQMQASVRVIPGCFITGQAAGIAASLASDSGSTSNVDIKRLQQKLIEFGAYLPNANFI